MEQIITKVKEELPPAVLRVNGGVGEIRFDPAARCLICYLPQAQQKEVEQKLKAER